MGDIIIVEKNKTHTFQATLTNDGSTWDISTATEITLAVVTTPSTTAILELTYTGGGLTWAVDGSDGVVNIAVDNSDTASLDVGDYLFGIDVTIGGETYSAMRGKFKIELPIIA